MFDYSGKVAVVTGGASGIGAATARALLRSGARVAILDRDRAAAQKMAEEEGAAAVAVVADISVPAEVERAFAEIDAHFQRLDVLVSNAGVRSAMSIEKMPAAEWQRIMDINLTPSFLCLKAAIAPMRRSGGGAVAMVASTAAKHLSLHGGANYTTAKAGMLGLARQAAFELAPDKIRVNVVCPGPTRTAMSAKSTFPASKFIPLGDWVMPDDVANAILFLCSPLASMCTGTTLDVDGGFLLGNGISHEEYFRKRDVA